MLTYFWCICEIYIFILTNEVPSSYLQDIIIIIIVIISKLSNI